jgi:hypothetical protein
VVNEVKLSWITYTLDALPVTGPEELTVGLTPHPVASRRTEATPTASKRVNAFMGFSNRNSLFAAVWRRQKYTPATCPDRCG